MIDPIDHLDRLRRQVDEARFEPVERLDAQPDAAVPGVLRELAELRDQQIDVALALVVGRLPRAADRAVERTE